MKNEDRFVPLDLQKKNSLKTNFEPNEFYMLRKQKEKPENQLEPNINDIQRYSNRE